MLRNEAASAKLTTKYQFGFNTEHYMCICMYVHIYVCMQGCSYICV